MTQPSPVHSLHSAWRLALLVTVVLLQACGGDPSAIPTPTDPTDTDVPPAQTRWRAFDLDSLRAARAQSGEVVSRFLDESFIRMGVYGLDGGQENDLGPLANDEIYQILSGSGEIFAGERRIEVTEGAIVWVKAGQTHRIVAESAIEAVVYTSKSATGGGALTTQTFELSDVRSNADGSRNVWLPFLQVPSSILGAYLLPSTVGGDGTLTHGSDEINVVLSGSGRFHMGADAIDIGPGSIIYVESGVGHWFDALQSDLHVLIFWDQR